MPNPTSHNANALFAARGSVAGRAASPHRPNAAAQGWPQARRQIRRDRQHRRKPAAPKDSRRRSARHAAHRGRRRPAPHLLPQLPSRNKFWKPSPAKDVRINIWQPVADNGGGVGTHWPAIEGHAVRRIRPPHLRNAKRRRPCLDRARHHRRSRPCYTKIEGLSGGPKPIVWDMRIATSSIPRETLKLVLSDRRQVRRHRRPPASRAAVSSKANATATPAASSNTSSKPFPSGKDLQQDVRNSASSARN